MTNFPGIEKEVVSEKFDIFMQDLLKDQNVGKVAHESKNNLEVNRNQMQIEDVENLKKLGQKLGK